MVTLYILKAHAVHSGKGLNGDTKAAVMIDEVLEFVKAY